MGAPVPIAGPVLLLMGPLGLFFARFKDYLEANGVVVYKLSLPLHEFGFRRGQRLPFAGPAEVFPDTLRVWIQRFGIRHVFMYGDYISLHRVALQELRQHPQVSVGIVELGYLRPNFITLEASGVNARSGLPRDPAFIRSLPDPGPLQPSGSVPPRSQRQRLVKALSFILHAFQRYPLLPYRHKLQPTPWDLWAQYRGILRGWLYRFSEAPLRHRLRSGGDFVLVALQVASDSQVQEASPYSGMEPLIRELCASFAQHAPVGVRLVFKHHPRDRGYNHYGAWIKRQRRQHGLTRERVLYVHDAPLGPILASQHCRGLITISSTVGLQALTHGVPVKLMGEAFFDLPGLVHQGSLASFWTDPQRPDASLWRRFQWHLITTTQVWGNFEGPVDFAAMAPVLKPAPPGTRCGLQSQSC